MDDSQIYFHAIAELLLARCAASEENWKGGDLILSLLNAKIPVDVQVQTARRILIWYLTMIKVLALELLNSLLQKTRSLSMFACPTSNPLPSLTQVIDITTSEPLRKAAVECFYAHLSTISDD